MEVMNSTGDRNGYTLTTANRLWAAADGRFHDNYLALTRDRYHASLQTLEFSRTEEARDDQRLGRATDAE